MSRRLAFVQIVSELAKPLPDGPNGERCRRWYLYGASGPDNFDCSGVVRHAMRMVGGPDMSGWWTERMWNELPIVTGKPEPGDLALYGRPKICHVMVVMADGCVVGACGGDSGTTTVEVARVNNAYVKKRSSHLYRKDFRGFRRLDALDKQEPTT